MREQMAAGRALGYGRAAVWLWVLVPLIRLLVMAVLALSMSVVDMALNRGRRTRRRCRS